MSWLAVLVVLLIVIMVGAALFSVVQKDLIIAVIGTSVISVVLSVLFYLLQAPDVALTEAAIGVALSTIIFVIAIKKTDRYEE